MRAKSANLGMALLLAAALVALAVLVVPGLAAGLGQLVGGLWVTVMRAVVGLLGGIFGG